MNIARYGRKASDWDFKMDTARKNLDWDEMIKQSIDPDLAREKHERYNNISEEEEVCSMCGEFCAIKILENALKKKKNKLISCIIIQSQSSSNGLSRLC